MRPFTPLNVPQSASAEAGLSAYLPLTYRVAGHLFDGLHQRRMVEVYAAFGSHCREELLGARAVGKGDAQFAPCLECQVQVLLVESDPEAGLEGPRDHPLPVDLEDLALRKAPEEGFPDFGHIGPCL